MAINAESIYSIIANTKTEDYKPYLKQKRLSSKREAYTLIIYK